MANRTAVSRDKVAAMPASSIMINVAGPTPVAQSGSSPCRKDQVSLATVSVRMPVCFTETQRRRQRTGRGRAPRPPSVGPGQGEGAHGGGLPGAGRGDRQLQPCPGGAHLERTREACPASRAVPFAAHFQQGQIDGGARRATRSVACGLRRRRGAARRRGSAVEVYRSAPATV